MLEAATRAFAARGGARVSRDRVGVVLGRSTGYLKAHYLTKSELVQAVVDDHVAGLAEALERLPPSAGPETPPQLPALLVAALDAQAAELARLALAGVCAAAREAVAETIASPAGPVVARHHASENGARVGVVVPNAEIRDLAHAARDRLRITPPNAPRSSRRRRAPSRRMGTRPFRWDRVAASLGKTNGYLSRYFPSKGRAGARGGATVPLAIAAIRASACHTLAPAG